MASDNLRPVPAPNELLRTLVDKVSAMIAYWDVDQRCRLANRAYEQWFGVTPEALIGKHLRELLGPLYALNLPYIEGALRGEPQTFEREIPTPSGTSSRSSLAHYIPDVVEGVVRGFFVLVTDVTELKRTELALRESEERFRLVIEEAPIGMALIAPDGRFVRVNRALCEIVGYTADELMALTFQEIAHPSALGAGLVLADALARGEIPRYDLETRCVRKDGAIVDVRLNGSVLRDREGAPIYFIDQIEDITERRRLQDELRLAEARSSGILSISSDAIISTDEDLRITMFNQGAERLFGYTSEEAVGASLDLVIPERYRAIHREHVAAFARGTATARPMGERGRSIVGLRKDGVEFDADAAISKLEVDGTAILTVALRDVTAQVRAEHQQRLLAEVGQVILATPFDDAQTLRRLADLAVRDLADFCIVDTIDADGELRRLTVTSRDPAKAWICELLANVRIDRRRPHLFTAVLETRRPVVMQRPSAETIASFAQGEDHHRALRAAEIHSLIAVPVLAHERLLGVIAFVSSTVSRVYGPADVRLAEELARRTALSMENTLLYRAAQRAIQARDEVLGIVAHDLRNPLNAIGLHAERLGSDGAEPEGRSQKAAAGIRRSVARMDRLIHDLLDVTRMDAGPLPIDPVRLSAQVAISDAVESQRALVAAASLDLRVELPGEPPEILADRDRVLQVFENLIGNALKFTSPGGRITIGAATRGGDALFWVADTGSGIAPEDLPRLFDRFWQVGRVQRAGAGLGLAIAKGIVEAHGGRLWVESTPGRGSTFFFTIPSVTPDPSPRLMCSGRRIPLPG